VDFLTIDGGEGGTGASPLIFTDAVSLPFRLGFARVYSIFVERGLHEDVTFIGAGKLGLPDNAIVAFGLGVDMVNVGREAMLAVGCIQAQKCHTNHCPVGVATQDSRRARALDVADKSERVEQFQRATVRSATQIMASIGVHDPDELRPHMLRRRVTPTEMRSYAELYEWLRPGELLAEPPEGWVHDWKTADPSRFTA
jgi:glutamate synthase domain-containing protein 2